MGEKKTISNWVKYIKRGGGIINPVGDIDVIKAMLSKARGKLKTAQIDFDRFTEPCPKEVEVVNQLSLLQADFF